MSRFCTNCGNEIPEGAMFCVNCGEKAGENEEPQVVNVDNNEQSVLDDMPNEPEMGPIPDPVFSGDVVEESTNYEHYVEKPSIALAIAAMVCGILSILCCCTGYVGVILALAGLVMGIISIVSKKGGKGMAIAGIVCGAVGILLSIVILAASLSIDNYSDTSEIYDMIEEITDSL